MKTRNKLIQIFIILLITITFFLTTIYWVYSGRIVSPRFHTLENDKKRLGIFSYTDFGYSKPEEFSLSLQKTKLNGWIFLGKETSRCGVIVHHGFRGTRWGSLIYGSIFYPRCHVLVYDSRAHGNSEGEYTTLGAREKEDLIAISRWFMKQYHLQPKELILIGESMGAASVLLAESIHPGLIIADSPYSSFREIILERAQKKFDFAQALLVWPVMALAKWRAGFSDNDVNISKSLRNSRTPTIIYHSGTDTFTSPIHSRNIFLSIPHKNKLLFFTDWGAKHARSLHTNRKKYIEVLNRACQNRNFFLACLAK